MNIGAKVVSYPAPQAEPLSSSKTGLHAEKIVT